jgi:hypothetical protein
MDNWLKKKQPEKTKADEDVQNETATKKPKTDDDSKDNK